MGGVPCPHLENLHRLVWSDRRYFYLYISNKFLFLGILLQLGLIIVVGLTNYRVLDVRMSDILPFKFMPPLLGNMFFTEFAAWIMILT